MKRLLINLLTALSLLLLLATVAMCVRSFWAADLFVLNDPGGRPEEYDRSIIEFRSGEIPRRPPPLVYVRWRMVTSSGGLNLQWIRWTHNGMDGEFEPIADDFMLPDGEVQWWGRHRWFQMPARKYALQRRNPDSDTTELHGAGLQFVRGRRDTVHILNGACQYAAFTMPIPLLTLLTAILPAHWFWRAFRRKRKYAPGLCPHCGYDLRAHLPQSVPPTQNSEPRTQNFVLPPRCPECGTPIPHPSEARP